MSGNGVTTQAVAPRPPATGPAKSGGLRCFTVVCDNRTFGLPVEHIQTVFEITAVTPVPLAPKAILGLVNLRGKIATAVSLRCRMRGEPVIESSRLAVGIDYRGESFALVVDEVGDVLSLQSDWQLNKPPHLGTERVKIDAVYRLDDMILPVLALDWVFAFEGRH